MTGRLHSQLPRHGFARPPPSLPFPLQRTASTVFTCCHCWAEPEVYYLCQRSSLLPISFGEGKPSHAGDQAQPDAGPATSRVRKTGGGLAKGVRCVATAATVIGDGARHATEAGDSHGDLSVQLPVHKAAQHGR